MALKLEHVGVCQACGKVRYTSRKNARRALKKLYPHEASRLSAYRCDGYWHIGHVPYSVKAGQCSREERYGAPES